MNGLPSGHDVVVIGASAGGVEALRALVAGLPARFAASVFVVLHVPAHTPSGLASILDRSGPLPATQVKRTEAIRGGHIYVAAPGLHLVIERGKVRLDAGPRENRARPAVDVLFRSAARAYGPRVVGVVLSGTLSDGALGLAAIKICDGVTIVQDPEEALFSGMPESALNTASVDYCLRVASIPRKLVELANHAMVREPMEVSGADPNERSEHAADEPGEQPSQKQPNRASGLTCPECHGSLWELSSGDTPRFECRIGHAYSVEALIEEQGETVEAALWAAINSLQERAATFRRLSSAVKGRMSGRGYAERAERTEQQAHVLHDLLRRLVTDGLIG
jgi:two-component system chemotaxis response regulator CheB